MSDRLVTAVCATSGLPLTANGPVRLYLTGTSYQRQSAPATGGEDSAVYGIAKRAALSAGIAVAVLAGVQDEALVNVSTTVAVGQRLQVKDRRTLKPCGTTTGLRFVAIATKGRTNAGATWVAFTPGGIV